jgi:hypothetical protein
MVKPSNPRSSSSSRVALTIAIRDFSLRRRGVPTWLRSAGTKFSIFFDVGSGFGRLHRPG